MKRFILSLGISLAFTLGMAQVGTNGYYGHAHPGQNVGINHGAAHGPPVMSVSEFQRARQTISRQRFERDRLRVAKQITRNSLLRSVQVKQLTRLFNFESNRLNYAKFAYTQVIDPDRYFVVNEAFRFGSSAQELDRYIATQVAYGAPTGAPANPIGSNGTTTTTVVHGSHGTTTYSGNVTVTSGHGGMGINHGAPIPAPAPATLGTCAAPQALDHMCPRAFAEVLLHIEKQCFDRDKILIAKQALRNKLVSVDMVLQVMHTMSFDSHKLEFAKWAYTNTFDQERYYLVSDGFTFSSSVRELDWYIQSLG